MNDDENGDGGGTGDGSDRGGSVRDRPDRDDGSDDESRIRVDPSASEPEHGPNGGGRSASESPSEPSGSSPRLTAGGPDPGPNAVRNWSALLVALAVVSFVTAAATVATHDDPLPVAGVTVLGVAFLAIAFVGRARAPWLLEGLDAARIEHRRYVWFATGLFAFGILVGVALLLAGVNLLELLMELLEEGLFPEFEDEEFELTATFFIVNNSQPFVLSIIGALSLGVLTAVIMLFNGIIVGNVVAAIVGVTGFDYVIVGLAPHGIFELAALFIAAGVGFRLLYRLAERVLGRRDTFLGKPYVLRTLAFVGFAWLLLVLAAFVEAYVTPELLEMLFAERLEAIDDETGMP
ncbi:stage II sporulation protein M [Natrarchaeobius chitinivorans]|uniref:Stage II sporulation protein M n=1 Tax=Natrarchaeobius chitinivorans TaxID=1679083 RepID=A0A3N6LVN5_NATCH|nr:stage II sporulation protein M [Natrarchaeobius chitinivorans]RQG94533.1 stage II sporulation protein M [Natrarchaeobius chitinivorans]